MSRAAFLSMLFAIPAWADDTTQTRAREFRDHAVAMLSSVPGKDGKYSTALPDHLRQEIAAANGRDRAAWTQVRSREEWERFRDERIAALRRSLGTFPDPPKTVPVRVTRTIEAKDHAVENLLYESRPGVWVTGNLYRPVRKRDRMPVFLIVHSHHAPKEQGELQDMGITWAKLGCLVLVIDQLGHGERRQHPFTNAKDYAKEFRVGRQDYYFRYNLNLQLSLVGDSLMGWMAWDLMRGLDVMLSRPGADRERVILLGAVAGGGDPAAVTAALDPRISCVVPFNFGGPQPETRYPLPDHAEEWFNYAGSGSWESTRNLRDSAAHGFLPWVIVASVAPRRLIHAHEFSWDRDRDPVWKRYQNVWGFYNATDRLAFTTGTGVIHGNDPTASHCTNIGPVHRKGIYAALQKWFEIPVPEKESRERRPASDLRCWTEEAMKELKPRPLHELLGTIADRQLAAARLPLKTGSADGLWEQVRQTCRTPDADVRGGARFVAGPVVAGCKTASLVRRLRPGNWFTTLVLIPPAPAGKSIIPIVWCICQEGIHPFLRDRAEAVAILTRAGVAVAISDVSGTGAERVGDGRGRTSSNSAYSATIQMLGQTMLGVRLGDGLAALKFLPRAEAIEPTRLAIWGESLSTPDAGAGIAVPQDAAQPRPAEPLGATLASFLALRVKPKAVVARGGLVGYRSVLESPFVHVPHDALPVNVFRTGDLPDVWAHLAPRPLRLEGLVDGTNRRATGDVLEKPLRPVKEAYAKGGLLVKDEYSSDAELARWILEQLRE